jgi:hypothetical protein
MKDETKARLVVPLMMCMIIVGMLVVAFGVRFAAMGTIKTTYQVMRYEFEGTPTYMVQCAQWWQPGFTQKRTFIARRSMEDLRKPGWDEASARRKAEDYFADLVLRRCKSQDEPKMLWRIDE